MSKMASSSLLRRNAEVWRIVRAADSVVLLNDEPHVKAWKVTRQGRSCVVKYWTIKRLFEAAPQLAAEAQAVVQLREKGDHPLLILPFKSMIDYDVGAFTISPFAGASAAAMRANDWALLSNIELKELCKEMVICLLCTQLNFGFKEKTKMVRYLHKDIKLQNICYNKERSYFTLNDYGGFSFTDKSVWVDVRDMRYLDCQMAQYLSQSACHAAHSSSGTKAATSHTTDLYLTGLAAVHLFLGHMPAEIDLELYGDDEAAYLDAVWNFDWQQCEELKLMPEGMRDFLLKILAFDPADRFQSAAEALQHKWLQDKLYTVTERLFYAEAPWKETMQELRQDVMGHGGSQDSSTDSSSVDNNNSSNEVVYVGSQGGSSCDASSSCCTVGNVQDQHNTVYCSEGAAAATGSHAERTILNRLTCSTPSRSHSYGSFSSSQDSQVMTSSSSGSISGSSSDLCCDPAAALRSVRSISHTACSQEVSRYQAEPDAAAETTMQQKPALGSQSSRCATPVQAAMTDSSTQTSASDADTNLGVHVMLLVVKESAAAALDLSLPATAAIAAEAATLGAAAAAAPSLLSTSLLCLGPCGQVTAGGCVTWYLSVSFTTQCVLATVSYSPGLVVVMPCHLMSARLVLKCHLSCSRILALLQLSSMLAGSVVAILCSLWWSVIPCLCRS